MQKATRSSPCLIFLTFSVGPCWFGAPHSGQSRIRTCVGITRQIYSLVPLAARPSARCVRLAPFPANGRTDSKLFEPEPYRSLSGVPPTGRGILPRAEASGETRTHNHRFTKPELCP